MSWEGYEIVVCNDCGWLDYNYGYFDHKTCGNCNSTNLEFGIVDQTNGAPYWLDFKIVKIQSEKINVCESCGAIKVSNPARYKLVKCSPYKSNRKNLI